MATSRSGVVVDDEGVDPFVVDVGAIDDRNAAAVEFAGEVGIGIPDEEFAASHAGADFVFDRAEDEDPAASHVFAGVFAGGFSN